MTDTKKKGITKKDDHNQARKGANLKKSNNLEGQDNAADKFKAAFSGKKNPFAVQHGFRDTARIRNPIPGMHECLVNVKDVAKYQQMGYVTRQDVGHIADEGAGRASKIGSTPVFSGGDGVQLISMYIPEEWHEENQKHILEQVARKKDMITKPGKLTGKNRNVNITQANIIEKDV